MSEIIRTPFGKIVALVRAEREKQDAQWGGAAHDRDHSAADWRHFRRKFEDRAERELVVLKDTYKGPFWHESMAEGKESLVKIAALVFAEIEAIMQRESE